MSIHYQLNFDDILALQKDVIEHSYPHQIKKSYFKWISTVIIFVAILFLIGLSLLSAAVSAVIALLYYFMFPALYRTTALARAKSNMQQQNYAHLLAPCEVTLAESGITREIGNETSHFNWDTFIRLGEDDHHYFLYQTELQGLILPKAPKQLNSDETKKFQAIINQQFSHN